MFFLMRMTFWFSLVLLMLPFGGGDDGQQIGVRAKASAKVAYEMLGEPDESIKTGTVAKDAVADMIAKAETAAPAE